MSIAFLGRVRAAPTLASISGFSAAWMAMMATRYYGLSADDINGGIGIGVDDGSWLSTAYSACEPIGVIVGCWLAGGLSLRRVLLASVAIFLLAALLPAIVPGFVALLLSRGLTGMAAGAILPLSILTQLRVFGPAWRPLAIAIYASSTTMGPQFAACIDAWSVERYGWTAILWASLAPGLVSLVTGFFGLWREPIRWRSLIHADLAGVVSLAAGLGLFACGVSQGDRLRWFQSPAIAILMIAGGTCFALFLAHERRPIRHPVVTVGLVRRWNLALVALATLPLQLATIFSGTIVPSALIQLQGFRPEQIAPALTAALWPQFVSYSACVIALRFRAVDTRAVLVAGLSVVAIGCFCDLPITSDWIVANLNVGQALQGIGLPLIIVPLLHIFVGEVTPREGMNAASIFNVSRSLSGTVATAWATTSLRLHGQAKYAELLSNTGFYPDGHKTTVATILGHIVHADTDPVRGHLQALQIVAAAARRQASVLAVSDTLAHLGWLLFASCVLAILMAALGNGHPERRARTES
jgi:MFS transporter, DHA2 family, multidrug resistance protein